ncbi:amino acid ABC transporter permease [Nitratireductor aquibiodomus RA22]|uniref:Amino acid ABC transporter permease n=1 Tax=Nitratireductor aquibiodomus RA22 TaxID=1189611 RepID=I5C579_9HYPH|nr:ABC transporter permease subunit [Nitratireductor aquibiodomus]EIM76981.1 amino acid ABC transporter permease [Nitratireductor aquibiodomus RA22]
MNTLQLLAFGDTGWGDEILRGAAMTLVIAVLGFAGGLIIALPIAAARLSANLPLRVLSTAYVTVVRGVPELLVIYLLFFGGSKFYRFIADMFGFTGGSLDGFAAGVSALMLIAAAYSAEVFRGAFQAIPSGQTDAAMAFGMNRMAMFRHITFPQMLRHALPPLANVWQLVIKDTALISVTGLVELMRATEVAAGSTRNPFLFFSSAIIIFLLFTSISNKGFDRAERRFSRHLLRGDA